MQTYVPTSMETYFSDTLLHPIWNSPAPRGFEKTCAELLSITFPYLQSR